MKPVCLFLCLLAAWALQAQNPICPPGVYIADPSAKADGDGVVRVYGSTDESPQYYCSHRYDVLSSADMLRWELHRNSFSSMGADDGVPYADSYLYAPDAARRGSKWYLYYCLSDFTGGVATASSPVGPFAGGRRIEGADQIDPCVFVDDDGQAYYYWGQFAAKAARLNPDMMSLDLTSIRDSVVTEREHYFHEGSFVFKRNGIYYYVYTHIGRQSRATCLGYATSRSPLGPFRYGGVIVDNAGCDPAVWNNHGSVAEFGGKWYVFYHRSTHNSATMRKACVEPITFLPDGSIPEVEMTSQGAGAPLAATVETDAASACLMFGNVRIRLEEGRTDNEVLGCIRDGDRAAWRYLDYGKGVRRFVVRLRAAAAGSISVVSDYPWRAPAGVLRFSAADGWQTLSCEVSGLEGVHALWLQFAGGEDGDLCGIDWIRFE